jgi:hypothetical protein
VSNRPSNERPTRGRSWWERLDRETFARHGRKRAIEARARQREQVAFMVAHGITRSRASMPVGRPATNDGSNVWIQGNV